MCIYDAGNIDTSLQIQYFDLYIKNTAGLLFQSFLIFFHSDIGLLTISSSGIEMLQATQSIVLGWQVFVSSSIIALLRNGVSINICVSLLVAERRSRFRIALVLSGDFIGR